jgi:site-specific DNA-adenine methylase
MCVNISFLFFIHQAINFFKYNLAKEIIEKHDVFSGYKQTETYKKAVEQLERLVQLERLQQIERLQNLNEIKATNKSYQDFSKVSGAILYLDPPYEGTSQDSYINSFDSQEFYDWAFEMAKNNIIIISSYLISDERFEAVYSFDKARSSFQGGTSNKGKNEKLFMIKGS